MKIFMGQFLTLEHFFNFGSYFGAIFDNMEVCERNSCVCGYHIYKGIWEEFCFFGFFFLISSKTSLFAEVIMCGWIDYDSGLLGSESFFHLKYFSNVTSDDMFQYTCTQLTVIIFTENISFSLICASNKNFLMVNYSKTMVL